MKTKIIKSFMLLTIVPASSNSISYLIGGIVALLIFGYLVYTLLHPEKF